MQQYAAVASGEAPRHFVAHNRHEHIQAATMQVVAVRGYHAATVDDICAEAHISVKSFHEHFSGKEEAVLSAVEAGIDQFMADCQASFASARSWPDAVWDGTITFTEWALCEPAFARTAIVELLAVGPPGLELLRSLMDAFALFLEPGYELLHTATPGALDETITGRVFELMHTHLTRSSLESIGEIVPEMVRTTLTPFLGPHSTEELIARRSADP